jgi:hypothetical protein
MNIADKIQTKYYIQLRDAYFLPNASAVDKTNLTKIMTYVKKQINHLEPKRRKLLFLANEEFLDRKESIDLLILGTYDTNRAIAEFLPEKDTIYVKPFFGKNRTLKVRGDIEEHSPYYKLFPEEIELMYTTVYSSEKEHKIITTTSLKPSQEQNENILEIKKFHQNIYNQGKKIIIL